MSVRFLQGDTISALRTLPAASVHCIVTSPPFWGLRDYGHAGQYGLEPTLAEYVERMTEVGRELRRVLRDDGVMWWEHGDSYTSVIGKGDNVPQTKWKAHGFPSGAGHRSVKQPGLKPKDLTLQPMRVAMSLQADGWYLRAVNIWHKPNPMPESVTDRTTTAHSYVFMFAKSQRYFYNADAVKEIGTGRDPGNVTPHKHDDGTTRNRTKAGLLNVGAASTRNLRSVWTIATEPCAEAHFALMPTELARRCIAAGCPAGGAVLDPFSGGGTTAMVADRLGRDAIGVELNPDYIAIAEKRLARDRIERGTATRTDQAAARLAPTPLEALL